MSDQPMKVHNIRRTSPKGDLFLGVCVNCGTPNLKTSDMNAECVNQRGVTQDEALIEAIQARAPGMATEIERLRAALVEAEDTLRLVEHPAFPDPIHHASVVALGRTIGFGALMSSASAGWREANLAHGYPAGGEFVAGPCHGTVARTLGIIRAALKQD